MADTPEVSIVIAAYNHAEYIAETIRSVLRQAFQDFEIIVVDDGSGDNTKEIVSGFTDKRIKYFFQENSGLPACARNKGIGLAGGKYIALLDGDDLWYPEKLKICRQILEERPEKALVCHNLDIMYNQEIIGRTSFGPNAEAMYEKLLFTGNCLGCSAVMLRSSVFFDGGFKFCEDKGLFTVEDYELWLRLSRKYGFFFIPDALGCYRETDSGAFLNNAEANTLNMLKLLDRHFSAFGRKNMQRQIKKRRSAVMCAAGRIYHHKNNLAKSRQWYGSALREDRSNYKAAAALLAAFLKIRLVYR